MSDNKHASPEMARIILTAQRCMAEDEAAIKQWKAMIKKERSIWAALTENERNRRRAMGTDFVDAQIKEVQLRNKTRAFRRKLRYKLFRIREGKWQDNSELQALKSWYELQFRQGWSFRDFTFEWDISAIDPLKVISPYEWDGDLIKQTERIVEGTNIIGKFCDPTAFTKQEM